MPIRDKIERNAASFLEPGEKVQAVFAGQTGPSPYFAALTYLIFFWVKAITVVATDRRILVLKSSLWAPSSAKSVLQTLPRETRIGPVSGLWARVELGGERYWVHKRFHKDIQAADAALPGSATA